MNLQEIINSPIEKLEYYLLNETKEKVHKTLYELNKNLHETLHIQTEKYFEIRPVIEDYKKKELIELVEKLNIWKKLSYNPKVGKLYIDEFVINYSPPTITVVDISKKIVNHHVDVPFVENQISLKTTYNYYGDYHYLQRCEQDVGFGFIKFGEYISFELDKRRGEFTSDTKKISISFDGKPNANSKDTIA
jgi:hypothetical protein